MLFFVRSMTDSKKICMLGFYSLLQQFCPWPQLYRAHAPSGLWWSNVCGSACPAQSHKHKTKLKLAIEI